jgi:5-formyltetrahydrofolate cyclo-ligase
MQDKKRQLRTALRAQRKGLSPAEVTAKSRLIIERLFAVPLFLQAPILVLYNADENEVVTEAIWREALKQGKSVYYPRITVDRENLEFVRRHPEDILISGTFGILIPPGNDLLSNLQPTDVVLTPGVGFDLRGHRLGRGKGYYDRAFRGVLAGAMRVALAYELQIVAEIPTGPDDERVQWIITEERLIECLTEW